MCILVYLISVLTEYTVNVLYTSSNWCIAVLVNLIIKAAHLLTCRVKVKCEM